MLHDMISSGSFGFSFYLKCDCGKEMLHFAYFPEALTYEEILYIKYYGPDSDNYNDIINLTDISLRKFSDYLKLSLTAEGVYEAKIESDQFYLTINKDDLGFYYIKKERMVMSKLKNHLIWEISLRDFTVKKLIEYLDKMYDRILMIRKEEELAAKTRYEEQKKLIDQKRKSKYYN